MLFEYVKVHNNFEKERNIAEYRKFDNDFITAVTRRSICTKVVNE